MKHCPTHSRTAPFVLPLLCFLSVSHGQEVNNRTIYLLANSIADDVELIREVMGRPYDDSPRLPASEVSSRELFLQTQTMLRKINQLAEEAGAAEGRPLPPAPAGEIGGQAIYDVLEVAQEQLALVKDEFDVSGTIEPIRRQSNISNTGIFMTVVDVNRQLNLMLDQTISAADVFGRVALVNIYAAGIIAHLAPDAPRLGLPQIDAHFRPRDIYSKLLECLEIVGRIARRVDGAEVMSLSSRRNIPDDIEPGHVYDIAQILVADVATLSVALEALDTPTVDLPVPERIFPTHAYQRALLLEQQLERIDDLL